MREVLRGRKEKKGRKGFAKRVGEGKGKGGEEVDGYGDGGYIARTSR